MTCLVDLMEEMAYVPRDDVKARDISAYRVHIEAALAWSGDTHRYDDVRSMIAAGRLQFWPGPASCIISEIIEHPRKRTLHLFLAGGSLPELHAMLPLLLDWGRTQGCTHASLFGRKGWARSFLSDEGWTVNPCVLMEKPL